MQKYEKTFEIDAKSIKWIGKLRSVSELQLKLPPNHEATARIHTKLTNSKIGGEIAQALSNSDRAHAKYRKLKQYR